MTIDISFLAFSELRPHIRIMNEIEQTHDHWPISESFSIYLLDF